MNPKAPNLIVSWSVRQMSDNPSPKLRLVAAILVAVVLVLGIYWIESNDSSNGFVDAQNQGICDRTPEVQLAIIDWLGDKACENFTDANLLSLTDFSVEDYPTLISLKSGDFAGMTNILKLRFQRNSLEELPADIFDGLDALTELRIGRNNLTDLPAGIFAGLPNLVTLTADGNYFTSIDSDWFDGFEGGGTLTRFEFTGNDISVIDVDTFEGFTAQRMNFYLSYNKLRTLPVGLFDGTSPRQITLHFNELESLPSGLFDKMTADGSTGSNTSMTRLNLNDNNLTTLPSGLLDYLQGLAQLRLHRNQISSLPSGLLDNNSNLYEVRLGHNNLTSLPSGFFANNPGLRILDLNDNAITSLNDAGLVGLHELQILRLHNNRLTQLPDDYVTSFVEDANAVPPTKYCLVGAHPRQQSNRFQLGVEWFAERLLDRVRQQGSTGFGSLQWRGSDVCQGIRSRRHRLGNRGNRRTEHRVGSAYRRLRRL